MTTTSKGMTSLLAFIFLSFVLLTITPTASLAQTALHSWYNRIAHIDLDNILDNGDLQRIESNLDSSVRYLQNLGVNTVIITAYSETALATSGQIDTVYFTNPVLPDRGAGSTIANLFKFAAEKFATKGFKVGAKLPLLRLVTPGSELATENLLEYTSVWDPKTSSGVVPSTECTSSSGCRLTPFSDANKEFVLSLYSGLLSSYPALSIIMAADDRLTSLEDCSEKALEAYVDAGITTATTCRNIMSLDKTSTDWAKITAVKYNAVSTFFGSIITELRVTYPNIVSSRQVLSDDFILPATSISTLLTNTDLLAVKSFPFTSKATKDIGINPETKAFNTYLKGIVDSIKVFDPNLTRTAIILETQYTPETSPILTPTDPLMLREWVRALVEDYGVYHIGFMIVRPLQLIPTASNPLRSLLEKANNRCIGTETPDPQWNCPVAPNTCVFSPTVASCRVANAACIANPTSEGCIIIPSCVTSTTTETCPSYRCTLNDQAPGCHRLYIRSVGGVDYNTLAPFTALQPGSTATLAWNRLTHSHPSSTPISVLISYQPYSSSSNGPTELLVVKDDKEGVDLATGSINVKIPDQARLGRNITFKIQYIDSNGRDQKLETDPTRGSGYTVPYCATLTSVSLTGDSTLPFSVQYQNRCVGGASCDILSTGLCQCQAVAHSDYTSQGPYDLCDTRQCKEFVNCKNDGICLNNSFPFKCLCDDDLFSGNQCQIDNWCKSKVREGWCLNGGHSEQKSLPDVGCKEQCVCPSDSKWTGNRCETCDIQCRNGAQQSETCGCLCRDGYFGKTCQCRRFWFQFTLSRLPKKVEDLYTTLFSSFFKTDSDGTVSLIPTQSTFLIRDSGIIKYLQVGLADGIVEQMTALADPTKTIPFITVRNLRIDTVTAIITTSPFSLKIVGHVDDNCSADLEGNDYDGIAQEWEEVIKPSAIGGDLEKGIHLDDRIIAYTVAVSLPDLTCDGIYGLPKTEDGSAATDTTTGPTIGTQPTLPEECTMKVYTSPLDGLNFEGEPNSTQGLYPLVVMVGLVGVVIGLF